MASAFIWFSYQDFGLVVTFSRDWNLFPDKMYDLKSPSLSHMHEGTHQGNGDRGRHPGYGSGGRRNSTIATSSTQ
jgi:hypothetical protein